MTVLGVNIAIFQDEQLVLTQRDDFAVWCLPGGGVDEGESIAAATQLGPEDSSLELGGVQQ